jgi:hypothetical protein
MPFEAGVMRLDWLAELSATELEIGAVTGHATSKEISRYTRAARQKILTERAMAKLSAGQKGNKMSHCGHLRDVFGPKADMRPL